MSLRGITLVTSLGGVSESRGTIRTKVVESIVIIYSYAGVDGELRVDFSNSLRLLLGSLTRANGRKRIIVV